MDELTRLFVLFGVGVIAGVMNVMAGGGSSLSLPILIFMGLDSAVANGTNRIAIFIQNIAAILSFRQQKFHQFTTSLKMAVWTLPGGIIGALVAIRISDEWFQRILAVVLLGVILSMLIPQNYTTQPQDSLSGWKRFLIYPALFGIGFYGGFIQVGVGFLLMAALYHLLRVNLVVVNMHKVFIVFIYTVPALAIFIFSGNVDWILGLSLAAGNSLGGWWAARLSVKKGEKIIRWILFLALMIMAYKLFR
ncbi:MAG: sulfite exporter TauE/SafE family protein [Calditrichaeota bacterium]|nr:MAG: sulfite exporter TauE/SafE family protein [Calditrichota bacterium]